MINKQLTNRRNLTTIERERIVQLQDVNNSDKSLLGHLIIKFLQFNAEGKLNTKGEFWQTYDDIRNAMMSGITDNPLREQLKRLTEAGYITYQYKGIENDKLYRKAIHLAITDQAISTIIGDDVELNSNPKDKYEILQKVRYEHKPKKEFTPEVFVNTKSNPTKTIENNTATTEPAVEHIEPDEVTDEPINPNKEINKAQLLIENKDNPNLRPIFNDLRLANDDIYYLYSSDYIVGKNEKMDSKKETLDLVIDIKIKPLMREMVY